MVGLAKIRNASIRTRLFALFAIPVLVIVSTRTFELTQEYNARLTAASDRAISLARSGIERQESLISEIQTLLSVLSRVPDITDGSAASCRRLLSDVVREKPWLKGLWVVEPGGRSVCSTVPGGVGLTFSDKHYFRNAVDSRRFVIEHYWVGRLRGLPAAAAAFPVLDRSGAVTKVILASVDLDWLVSIQDEVVRGADATFLLVDESGIVLARYPEIESLVERNFSGHPLVAAMAGASQGQFEMPDLDGEQRIFGFARLPGTQARLAIGFSRKKVLEAINWQTYVSVINLALICGLGLIVAWIGGDRIVAAKLRDQKEQLDAAVNNMPQGLCMFDEHQRLVLCNSTYAEMYGLRPDQTSPGTTLASILKRRVETGNSPENAEGYIEDRIREVSEGHPYSKENELRDGRIISVTHQPMANGGWVAIHQDVTEQRRIEQKIAYMAHHDALTGLPNRVQLREKLEHALEFRPRGQSIAVLCLDLDHFKNVNDTLGHPIGDALLRFVAERLRGCVRDTDIVARLGGDEFAIVQVGAEQPVSATILAQRLIDVMAKTFEVEGHQVIIGTSVGIAVAPTDSTEPDQLQRNADMALYRAKADGRNAFRFFEATMDAKMQERRSLELDLRKALEANEFELFYQPQVKAITHEVVGFEALLRWNHPTRGRVSPDQFIGLAEETGIINALGEWVLRQACWQASTWPNDIRVAVNLSPVQFRNRGLVSTVVNAIAAAGLSANRLELEITEAVLLQSSAETIAVLHQLRSLGVRIGMDDFGTGYSSLSYLRNFPFDEIKIDRSFVRDLTERKDSIAIIRAVSRLGADLGMTTTAEGVETEEQLAQVEAEGCTQIQGYLFGAPCAASEIEKVLTKLKKVRSAA